MDTHRVKQSRTFCNDSVGDWNQRNQAWLNHAAASLHQIFQISKEKLAEFTACQPSATPMLCKTGQSQN